MTRQPVPTAAVRGGDFSGFSAILYDPATGKPDGSERTLRDAVEFYDRGGIQNPNLDPLMQPLRLLRRGSPGQAMVLGAVAMLALVLGVLATLNLGQAVHEKIKLQNTADAAAYSLATLEARTFNFIALTNRLQITHYHSAMVMQSYLSHAGFALAYFGSFLDILRGLAYGVDAACRYVPVPFLKTLYCPFVSVLYGASQVLDQIAAVAQQLYAFAVFGLGFLARPVGGLVLGRVGDRIGRRALLTLSIALMGGATLALGLLPTYEKLGVTAAVLLLVLRLIQGLSVGGEYPTSVVLLVEWADPRRRGFMGSWSVFGAIAGILLGSAVAALITAIFSAAEPSVRAFQRLTDAEQPPSSPSLSIPWLPVEIDLHREVGGCGYFEPVLAHIQLGAAVVAPAGFAPAAQDGANLESLAPPDELMGEPGFPGRHAPGVTRGNNGLDDLTDESLRHYPCSSLVGALSDSHRAHRHRAERDPFGEERDRFLGAAQRQRIEERQVVLVGRNREPGRLPHGGVIGQPLQLACQDQIRRKPVELPGPRVRRSIVPAHEGKVVHYVSTPENKHPILPQRLELSGQGDMLAGRTLPVEGELHHRDVGIGIHLPQDRPCPVVEPPRCVRRHTFGTGQLPNPLRQIRRPLRRVLHPVEFLRKAVEIVDRPW